MAQTCCLLFEGLCDIASGYEHLASRVCGWQIGIIAQNWANYGGGCCARKKGNFEVSMEAERMAISFAVLQKNGLCVRQMFINTTWGVLQNCEQTQHQTRQSTQDKEDTPEWEQMLKWLPLSTILYAVAGHKNKEGTMEEPVWVQFGQIHFEFWRNTFCN